MVHWVIRKNVPLSKNNNICDNKGLNSTKNNIIKQYFIVAYRGYKLSGDRYIFQ